MKQAVEQFQNRRTPEGLDDGRGLFDGLPRPLIPESPLETCQRKLETSSVLLYYITDRSQFPGPSVERRAQLLDRIAQAAEAGVDWIQLREKDLAARALAQLAEAALRSIEPQRDRTRLLINSRLDIALAVGAGGVHLASDDLAANQARLIASQFEKRNFLVGVSCHAASEVRLAAGHGADFAVLAPIFEKILAAPAVSSAGQEAGHASRLPGIGCEALIAAKRGASLPILALGGVNLSNAASCLAAGAAGVAAIRLFQQGDLAETVRRLRSLEKLPART
jgi:thiamine-phosphate pyrophosphorylase